MVERCGIAVGDGSRARFVLLAMMILRFSSGIETGERGGVAATIRGCPAVGPGPR